MPKTPLKASPLAIVSQDFLEIALRAMPGPEHDEGALSTHRETTPIESETQPRRWMVVLRVALEATNAEKPPSYVEHVLARGIYEVHEAYQDDPERLIRVTGASMLYGAVRELVASFTARSANGMVTLPSVSFYEKPPAAPGKKPTQKKAAK